MSLHCESAHLEDVLQALQCHGDDAVVADSQQLAEGLDAAILNQCADLVLGAARGGVADCPCSLLLDVKLSAAQQINQRGDEVGLDDSLDLVLQVRS